jgi:exopolyphosphatase/guanosine-5'-triphosphate,3'-diphosphate pyrophosphatase
MAVRRHDQIAAVDLGSNSFHMIVAHAERGQLRLVDRLRERVALASGIDARKQLTAAACARALACLERFGQRLRQLPRGSVRAVGTNTLRQARNARGFLIKAQRALGHPIEIISGREEARLIYLGVARSVEQDGGRRLVVDIGGGSTECAIGERFEVLEADSLYMGCVSFSERFFPGGKLTEQRFERAFTAAALELEPIERRYRAQSWQRCLGSSGTILAIGEILRQAGWAAAGTITGKGLRKLERALLEAGRVDAVALPGLTDDRAAVLPGGLAILRAVFEALGIERMAQSTGALREGLLYDLRGRIRRDDVRDQTVRRFAERYRVDGEQAARVERAALLCLDQVARPWQLDGGGPRQLLVWAARLHEVGLSIAYSGYHKHGSYLIANADMPGFSREDQHALASLILNHRRKLRRALLRDLSGPRRRELIQLAVLLRLAVHLCRSRTDQPLPAFRLRPRGEAGLGLRVPRGWLRAHKLIRTDLALEAEALATAEFTLTVR